MLMLASFLFPSCVHYYLLFLCIVLMGPGEKFFVDPPHFHLMPGGMYIGIDAILNGAHEPDYVCIQMLMCTYNKYMCMLICN